MRNGIGSFVVTGFLMGLGIALGIGCAGWIPSEARYDYFTAPDPSDPWSPKITGWQRRERADEGSPIEVQAALDFVSGAPDRPRDSALPRPARAVSGASSELTERSDADLRGKYLDFRASRRRQLARSLAEWIQELAPAHYFSDGPIDHWATFEETLRRNGDDCDGLELLVYHGLRDLGFGANEVYRAIVYRPSDGQHHMVTLWFEDASDPWVIDPTGAMTRGMPRMSDLPDWVPLKVFSEDAEFTVRSQLGRPAQDPASLLSRR